MTQIGLECSRIQALVCQRVTASMLKHVRMDLKADLGFLAGAGEQLGKARHAARIKIPSTPHQQMRRWPSMIIPSRAQFIVEQAKRFIKRNRLGRRQISLRRPFLISSVY